MPVNPLLIFLLIAAAFAAAPDAEAARPNVIFILTDDQREGINGELPDEKIR